MSQTPDPDTSNERNATSLWKAMLIYYRSDINEYPETLLGRAVVDRILASSNVWRPGALATTIFAIVAGIGTACFSLMRDWDIAASSAGLSTILVIASFYLWRLDQDVRELHLLASTRDQHDWVDRLSRFQKALLVGEIETFLGTTTVVQPWLRHYYLAGGHGLERIVASAYEPHGIARRRFAKITAVMPLAYGTALAPEVPLEPAMPSVADPQPVSTVRSMATAEPRASRRGSKKNHYLYMLPCALFDEALESFFREKIDESGPEKRALLSAAYVIVQDQPRIMLKTLVIDAKKLATQQGFAITLADDSISKLLSTSNTHDYAAFRIHVLSLQERWGDGQRPQGSLF